MRSAAGIPGLIWIATRNGSLFVVLLLATILTLGPATQSAGQARQDGPSKQGLDLPMFRQAVPGLLMRARFTADVGSGGRVLLWDLLVGPGQQAKRVRLPGPAVLEVRGGTGVVLIDKVRRDLRPGASLSIPEGASLLFANARRDLGLDVRVTIVTGGSK